MKSEESSIEFPSPLGQIRATATDRGVSSLHFVERAKSRACAGSSHRHLQNLRAELDRYFGGTLRKFTVPLDVRGTPFQELAWEQLRNIPYGKTIAYKEEARRMGNPKASRAVGGANGANPVCIIIPCHRVIAADGSLGGYSSGLERKKKLLALEGAV